MTMEAIQVNHAEVARMEMLVLLRKKGEVVVDLSTDPDPMGAALAMRVLLQLVAAGAATVTGLPGYRGVFKPAAQQ
jgi:hypothetical protein